MVDTHTHLGLCEPDDAELVAAAAAAGVERMLTVGLDEDSNREAIEAAAAHDGVRAAVGRHPNSAAGWDDAAAADLAELAHRPEVAAIGETGLDYYHERSPRADQRRAFDAQLEIARDRGKPVVIHMRSGDGPDQDAVSEAMATLAGRAEGVEVVLHCFSAGVAEVEAAADRGWYCSFAGNVTYPQAGNLRAAARAVPDALLLAETDAPFLSPQPVRGRPNQPAHVVATAEVLADERGVDYPELERLVAANAARVFRW